MASWPSSVTSMPGRPRRHRPGLRRLGQPGPYACVLQTWADIPAKRIVIDTPDKENGVYLARQNIRLRDDDPTIRRWRWPITCWAAPA
jgi:hypothetical protein